MNTDKHLPSAPLGAVEAEVRNALRELDSVTALDDDQSDGIGCAENALHRALDAIAHAEALLSFMEDAERWREAEKHFRIESPDMGGNHRWTWTGHRYRGPSIAAAIDAARKEAES